MSDIPTYPYARNEEPKPRTRIQGVETIMQIFCCKIYVEHVIDMDYLIQLEYYFSRSEIVRKATNDLLEYNDYNGIIFDDDRPKFSAAFKLPIDQLDSIDQAAPYNRSRFIRKSLDEFMNNGSVYPDREITNRKIVVAFKLEDDKLQKIRNLCKTRFASFSEFVRLAIRDLEDSAPTLIFDEFHWGMDREVKKTPVSIKFPLSFKEHLNELAEQFRIQDRSKLLREAVTRYLLKF